MTPEKRFWVYLREHGFDGHVTRIENTAGIGTPDVNLVRKGCEMWLELKVAPPGKVLIRKEQRVWGYHHAKNGGNVYVLSLWEKVINVYMYPLETEKHDDKYQKITSEPIAVFHQHEVEKLLNFITI